MDNSPAVSKIRVICISDTHNHTPSLPEGQVLIHAGDLTNRGSLREITNQVHWLKRTLHNSSFASAIVVAGNHDITLHSEYYAQFGAIAHGTQVQDDEAAREMMRGEPKLDYLAHQARNIKLQSLPLNVFGSPWSRRSGKVGDWAFGYEDGNEAEQLWAEFENSGKIDILVAHGPPLGICDEDRDGKPDGCPALLKALSKVRPRLVICGHRHEGRGCLLVEWDPEGNIRNRWKWIDTSTPESQKISLVDLTGKKGLWKLDMNQDREADGIFKPLSLAGFFEDANKSWTCVVNAAIMAHSFGKKKMLNKPIAVDIQFS